MSGSYIFKIIRQVSRRCSGEIPGFYLLLRFSFTILAEKAGRLFIVLSF